MYKTKKVERELFFLIRKSLITKKKCIIWNDHGCGYDEYSEKKRKR